MNIVIANQTYIHIILLIFIFRADAQYFATLYNSLSVNLFRCKV